MNSFVLKVKGNEVVSRVGNLPVPIPDGVSCELKGSTLSVTGPKGKLEQRFQAHIGIEINDGEIVITRPTDENQDRAFHGLTRTLISNMGTAVSKGC